MVGHTQVFWLLALHSTLLAHAAPLAFSARSLDAADTPTPCVTHASGQVFWASDAVYQLCSVDKTIHARCGERRSLNLTKCTTMYDANGGGLQKKTEFIVGPITSTGGYDWLAVKYAQRALKHTRHVWCPAFT
jgi:hypothetical protein